MFQGLRKSPQSARLSFPNRHEAKYPALLFRQQLTAFLEKIYGMITDNLKKEISPLLGLCIQAPRTLRASLANAVAQQDFIAHWQSIRESLNTYLNLMKGNHVPPFLVRKVFTQIFSVINVNLFNSLFLHRECCSLSNGEIFIAGLAELEKWCVEATDEFSGTAWDELKHIRQAVDFLVLHQKSEKTLEEITRYLCPVLSIHQLYRISTMCWDDKYGSLSVSPDVIAKMRVMMTEDSNNSSFLLKDESISFTVEDISKSMQEVDVNEFELIRVFDLITGAVVVTKQEEAKTQEYARQQEALQAMRLQIVEANAATKTIEEAPLVIQETHVLIEDIGNINSLTSEVDALKDALQEMQLQVEEANASVIREREAARKALEEVPLDIKQTLVLVEDSEKINPLTLEVEALKMERSEGSVGNSHNTSYNEGPLCHCRNQTTVAKSWIDAHPGRRYYKCGTHGFVGWADEEKPHGWQKERLIESRDQIQRLKEELTLLKLALRISRGHITNSDARNNLDEELQQVLADANAAKEKETLLRQFIVMS